MTSASTAPDASTRSPRGPLRSAVVFNPVRVEDMPARREVIESVLTEAGWPSPAWLETTEQDPGAGQARQAIKNGAELVFACGGDGTVRSCIEGLADTGIALAILPAGTGNLLATNLGVPGDTAAAVHLATSGGRHRIDIGEVEGRAFAVMAGIGFDAALLEDASSALKARIGAPAYVLSALRHLHDRPMTLQIRIDSEPTRKRQARTIVIGNVGRLQGGVDLLPDASPDSGQFDVAILAPRSLAHWVALAWGVVRRDRHVHHREVLRGSRITVTSDLDQPRQLDGDIIEPGRSLSVDVRPGALEVCVPLTHGGAYPSARTRSPAGD
ncbi:MAG: diacylglycerol/lipid kinase family protein [Cellulomonas sp.]